MEAIYTFDQILCSYVAGRFLKWISRVLKNYPNQDSKVGSKVLKVSVIFQYRIVQNYKCFVGAI